MNRRKLHTAILAALTIAVLSQSPSVSVSGQDAEFSSADVEFFEESVRPLLSDKCYSCHGPTKQESDLRLDSRRSILLGGASGEPAAIAGDAENSLLFASVNHTGDYEMPPDDPLNDEQIDILRDWIQRQLPWPANEATAAPATMDERLVESRQEHWAFQPIPSPVIPIPTDRTWATNPIDHFVLANLEAADLTPSPDADRWLLLRRLKFGLLGLPPTFEEYARFENDRLPGAYERLVDRVIADPALGERWGRHWLDVARYGDTSGYAFNRDRRYPYAYTYRDYVIRSFNDDKGYDRFITEQLAADAIEPAVESSELAALGFLTTGRRYNNIHDDIDDKIDVVTRGVLGLTVACARCHDHKYDAIPTEDYYSLYGVFASTTEPGELPLIGSPEQVSEYQSHLDQLTELRRARDSYVDQTSTQLMEQARAKATEYLARALIPNDEQTLLELPFVSLKADDLNLRLLNRWRGYMTNNAGAKNPVLGIWARLRDANEGQFDTRLASILEECEAPAANQINPLVASAFLEQPPESKVELARIYGNLFETTYAAWKEAGGDDQALKKLTVEQQQIGLILLNEQSPTWVDKNKLHEFLDEDGVAKLNQLREQVDSFQAAGPKELPRAMVVKDRPQPFNPFVFVRGQPGRRGPNVPRRYIGVLDKNARTPFPRGSGRLDLAERIVSPQNPLTARVIANRIWMHHFGEPLVKSPSDFGVRTEQPRQMELLDFLAWYLVDQDWSLKALHRLIVTSRAYRQSSVDREDCREIDPDNQLLWRMNRRTLEFEPLRDALLFVSRQLQPMMFGKGHSLTGADPTKRRAIYGVIDRQDLPNLLRAFDFASPDQSVGRRPKTIVPQQALFLMNSEFVAERAKEIIRQVAPSEASFTQSIHELYKLVFARTASDREIEIATRFLASTEPVDPSTRMNRWEQLAQLLLMTNEFAFVD